jgi:hypothetical protein
MLPRFEDGRRMRAVTTAYLVWGSNGLAAEEMIGLALIWDNTSPHTNQQVRAQLHSHNQTAKRTR